MTITPTNFDGLLMITPRVFNDTRGYFFENYNQKIWTAHNLNIDFVQDNESSSEYGVLRGLHYQIAPFTQAKLVRVILGAVLDVVVDLRRHSPTCGQHFALELSAENHRQLFIPRGFAHGFAVLQPQTIFAYKCDNFYSAEHERGIAYNDPQLNIDWQLPPAEMILSVKDEKNPLLKNAELL